MSENFTPLLTTRDWGAEWKELQKARRAADDASYWDERSKTFSGACGARSPYADRFLQLAGIRPGETVLDMGCGTGALSIPLGQDGHRVIAADFSQGMLARMDEDLAKLGIASVASKLMSWEDDWAACGVGPNSVDVALASRSIATADLRDSLLRLTDAARRRVCITLATGSSPRTDERILSAIGLQNTLGRDYLYAFNILAAEGFLPEVSYIRSARADTYGSFDEAYENLSRMARDAAAALVAKPDLEAALSRLREWLDANLVENERAGQPDGKGMPEGALRLREPRVVTWSFIAWEK